MNPPAPRACLAHPKKLLLGLLSGALLVAAVGPWPEARAEPDAGRKDTRPAGRVVRAWDEVVGRFLDGDLAGAVGLAQACAPGVPECKSGLEDLKAFEALYKKVEELDAPRLERLRALDKAITGERGPSRMARFASARAASAFYKSALAAKAKRQWERAVQDAQRTLQVEPSHAGATRLLEELRARAQELYVSRYLGHSAKDLDPEDMLPVLREIMALTPPEDEFHQKAKSWLEKLER
jgi:hypothetical protein